MAASPAVPVIIVGAGPVGLCAALALARHGVGSLLLERELQLPDDLRASTIHPPTLEMLEDLGLGEQILRRGLVARTWQIRTHETHERVVFDLGVLAADTRHPYCVQLEQSDFCRLALAAAQAERRIDIRFGAEARGLVRQEAGVLVRWRRAEGQEQALARYVIAADGAASTLRRLVGLAFEGVGAAETTVLATTAYRFEDHLPGLSPINHVWTADGHYALVRLPDRWRVSLYPAAGEDAAMEPWRMDEPARIEAKLQRIVPRLGHYELIAHRPYRVHPRSAPAFRSGRVLLAGDAAHVIAPSAGLGMNRGIHDAFSLAGSLARVLDGADESLLDGYDRERRAVAAAQVLREADAHRQRMRNRDPAWRRQELARLQAIAADRAAAREFLLDTSLIAGLRRSAA